VKLQGNPLQLQLTNFNPSMIHIGVVYIVREGFFSSFCLSKPL
jgi:hypothetical protein